jgi:ParB family chromosome partitioning protein
MSKKNILNKLATSVATHTEKARDKFENADLVAAMNRVKEGGRLSSGPAMQPADQSGATGSVISEPQTHAHLSLVDAETKNGKYAVAELAIRKVKDHPRNARHLYDPARIERMQATLARDGQQVPVIVMEDPAEKGAYLLIEGRYRKRGLMALGKETIYAIVVEPLDDLEAYRLSLLLNEERNEQTALDNALSWRSLLDDGIFKNQEHIADYLNIKQGNVSKTLALLDLPANVLAIVKASPASFGVRIGFELKQLAKILDERKLEDVAEQVRDGQLSARDLEKLRERADKPVTRERSRAYPLQWNGKALGSLREFEDGRLKIDLSGAPDHLRSKLIESVKRVLAESAVENSD